MNIFEILSVFNWIEPGLGVAHQLRQMPANARHVARGEPLEEHYVFVSGGDYNNAKAALDTLSTGPDVYDFFSDSWTMTIQTDDLEEAQNRLGMANVRHRS